MVFFILINWIKELFFKKDDSFIGLTRLQEIKHTVKEVSQQKIKKNKEDIKISDLIKGENY